jgi:hypothetical protein
MFVYIEEGKNKQEHENIIDAQAPLHEVSRNEFGSNDIAFLKPQVAEKRQRQCHPENGLP